MGTIEEGFIQLSNDQISNLTFPNAMHMKHGFV